MDPNSEAARLFQAEQAVDAGRILAGRREAERASGVAWSGLAPDPFPRRDAEALARHAAQRLAALRGWRASRPGALLAAMLQAERAVETVRTCVARGLAASDARCGRALGELERAAAAARAAMDAEPAGALSGSPCATNTASSSRSTGSPRNSAG